MQDAVERGVTPLGKKGLLCNDKEAAPSPEGKCDGCNSKHSEREGKQGRAPLRLQISCLGSGINVRSDLRCVLMSKGGL